MKVFLDTNVLVDFIAGREGAKDASDILQLGKAGGGSVELCTSVLIMAKAAGCDCIVTRNTRDFGFSPIDVLTPAEFLNSDDWHF